MREIDGCGSGTSVDCGVGSIVWVRRRNGSWWPGQIVGPEELVSSHLTSPRTGTPVKLLGREDASIDWYNLEKSKRVKPFRCGEFDACIKRVEASLEMPMKKREKYARREDAIVHALKLERKILEKQGKLLGVVSHPTDVKAYNVDKELCCSSEILANGSGDLGESNSFRSSKRQENSCANGFQDGPIPSENADDGNQLSGEEPTEVSPRMKGLQDIGLKFSASREQLSTSVLSNTYLKHSVDDNWQVASGSLPMESKSPAGGNKIYSNKRKSIEEGLDEEHSPKQRSEQLGVSHRAKRGRCVYLQAESSDSLDYKEAPNQVVCSTYQFDRESPRPNSLIGCSASISLEEIESDSSEAGSSESQLDSSETEPDINLGMAVLSGQDAEDDESTSSDEVDELAISGDMPHLYPRDTAFSNETVSKWQLKGKRNTRNLMKRPTADLDLRDSLFGPSHEPKRNLLNHRKFGHNSNYHRNTSGDRFDEANFIRHQSGTQRFAWSDEYLSTSRVPIKGRSRGLHGIDWENYYWEDQPMLKGYWDRNGINALCNGSHPFAGRRSILIDADVKVQSSYQRRTPIVSLTSKLDGKAIIGHRIQVEALWDGSSENLFPSMNEFNNGAIDGDGSSFLPQAWKTARRTANVRVPRHLSSSSRGVDGEDLCLDEDQKLESRKLNAGSYSHKASLLRKSAVQVPWPAVEKNFKKVAKKVNLSPNQKTRTLSSLAVEQNFIGQSMHSSNCHIDGILKPESSGPPTIACIPVKLVFSRLLEKINRPPSKATINAALLNSSMERNS